MIQDFVNALALTNEKFWFYLDRETMTIVKNRSTVDGMDVTYLAHAFPERFLPLPNKKQIHTYAIMEEYALNAGAPASQRLHMALQGAGPFKRFRDEAHRLGLEEDWLKYRDRRFEQMARDWCAEHHVKLPVNSEDTSHVDRSQAMASVHERTSAQARPSMPDRTTTPDRSTTPDSTTTPNRTTLPDRTTLPTSAHTHVDNTQERIHTPEQIVAVTAASIPETDGTAVALIESIRLLFHILDDAGFEAALDDLVKRISRPRPSELPKSR